MPRYALKMAGPITIEQAHAVDDELVQALSQLLPQLAPSAAVPTRESVRDIIGSQENTLLVARDRSDSGRIVGTLTLVVFRIPTGIRASIEDVVVSDKARGRGIGEQLTRHALEIARSKGARAVDLTSRPSRQAANALYLKLGFRRRETNVYRYNFEEA